MVAALRPLRGWNIPPIGRCLGHDQAFVVAEPYTNRVKRMDGYRETHEEHERGKILGSLQAKRSP